MAGSTCGDEVENDIVDIDEIQSLGVNASDIAKLKSNNIYTVASLVSTPSKRLLKIKGFSDTKVEKIKEAGKKLAVGIRFCVRVLC
ncbi:uncharacterized protein LY89DRAFT_36047 [Mollisia scopiformis]|uniref:Uncharacterized protein n=1 Tax=Mollisia scopiformis TaxID=149040 RepID=A0A194XE59_MOLSC|nr:uncharacterized protein LY89DRAFT_36047 [Mollisia scopiformis]KUJ18047.1 hypothetical protein LY89DRAFT_36047 [Mollisia scopiformis]